MSNTNEPLLDMFIFESTQLLEQVEQIIISCEEKGISDVEINEIFRAMHTIKGSASMMMFDSISKVAHSIEDLFCILREDKNVKYDKKVLSDIVLNNTDFIKNEIVKIEEGIPLNSDSAAQIDVINKFLNDMKSDIKMCDVISSNSNKIEQESYYIPSAIENSSTKTYSATIYFEPDCQMENIRAFTFIHAMKDYANVLKYTPSDIIENEDSAEIIKAQGFNVFFETSVEYDFIEEKITSTIFLQRYELNLLEKEKPNKKLDDNEKWEQFNNPDMNKEKNNIVDKSNEENFNSTKIGQSYISVSVDKLDLLMNLVSELVISESLVTQNPDLNGLSLINFNKAANQLKKITNELQDTVMSARMVKISPVFHKMKRIVRDMTKRLDKKVNLELLGEDTEVDKNIIDNISDPLMHIVRNAVDHGIEKIEDRIEKGKSENGNIVIEAKNMGSEVWIVVNDDGKGLDKQKIYQKAQEKGLINKSFEELTDSEIFSFIFLPGFSTKEETSEFSGRGVGMDVAVKNIEKIRGTVNVDKTSESGTSISLRIPLTLAIIDGMTIYVGSSKYTLPIESVVEIVSLKENNIIIDNDDNEIINIRGVFYPMIKLYERFKIVTEVKDLTQGITLIVQTGASNICLFADGLIGEQQVVIKPMPVYIKKSEGIAGCAVLGDGSMSLVIDVGKLGS